MPRLTFQSLLRSADIGANSYCLELGQTRVLLDAGMHPKVEGTDSLPQFDELRGLQVDAAILTHGHLDHVGALPVFQRQHPEAEVVMTEPTADIAEAMLHNSVNVMQAKRQEHDMKEYPFFLHPEIDRMQKAWALRKVGIPFSLGAEGVRGTFYEAGHILGAAGVLLECEGTRIFYTGDVHFEDQTLLRGAAFPTEHVDILIMETTRGATPRMADYTRHGEMRRLAQAISETLQGGGSVLMPVFALGKTQEMLLLLHEMHRSGLIPLHAPVQIGGLAVRMTQITDKFCDKVRRRHAGVRILGLQDLVLSQPRNNARRTTCVPGRIYALSSGMMSENTASNDFAFQFLDNPKNALLLVGYADPDSPAGKILAAQPGDPIRLHRNHAPVTLKCRVEKFDFSGHAPREALATYAERLSPRKILLVHGDAASASWFQQALSSRLPQADITIPVPGEILPLE